MDESRPLVSVKNARDKMAKKRRNGETSIGLIEDVERFDGQNLDL